MLRRFDAGAQPGLAASEVEGQVAITEVMVVTVHVRAYARVHQLLHMRFVCVDSLCNNCSMLRHVRPPTHRCGQADLARSWLVTFFKLVSTEWKRSPTRGSFAPWRSIRM